ncbi:MAG TPA: BTAD domain-containing putative transcriptional regulator [Acidimicrobiales bacterium]|nr:BTAD domain-containing putative transcriptional regulator [Acidimicrobiales bacterium]
MTAGGQSVLGAKVRIPRIKALTRERLDAVLGAVWDHRLGLVVAPAGSGKTTLLAQFAAAAAVPVAWYRAEPADASAEAAVAHLERGLVSALGLQGGWKSVDDVIEAIDGWEGDRALVVVDDLHALWGTEAEATLERLLSHLPPGVVMVAGTRRAPGFNLSRLRVSGELFEIGPEELRFRSWEVERLFLDFYGSPLRPDELAELARRTEGWAAGLQLFHLATRGKPDLERRRMLQELGMRSRLVREYLARNVLDELPLHVRDFLLQTCVLGRLTAPLCDELRGSTSSDALLAELEQRQIFTAPLDDEGAYRYHEVLRSHLEAALVESIGEVEARRRYETAGRLLERHGHLPEALRAYCRAEDWPAATNLLGGRGEQVIDRPGAWLEALPPTLLDHDPWLLLASARRAIAEGRWETALDAYRRAESASGPGQPGDASRRERLALEGWFAPAVSSPTDWTGLLRLAVVRDPIGVATREAARLPGAVGALTLGLAQLLDGRVNDAATTLTAVTIRDDVSPAMALGAEIGVALARALAGEPVDAELARLSEAADEAGVPWLVGCTRLAASLQGSGNGDALSSIVAKDDVWGLPLAQLCVGLGYVRTGAEARELLAEAADGFQAVGAPVLEAWARSGHALATALALGAGHEAQADARRALGALRSASLTGPVVLAASAAAIADPSHAARHRTAATAASIATGLAVTSFVGGEERAPAPVSTSALRLRCFGALEVSLDGEPLDLGPIKPRVRSLLRVLALHAGRPVHRDRLVDWLWPGEGDVRVGTRNLQVAISSLRQLLEPGVARGAAAIVVRDGDTYRLALTPGSVDLIAFDDECAIGRHARAAGERDQAIDALGRALELYRGELLADEGAAEWVTSERDRLRLAAADASHLRAELLVEAERFADAAAEADRGLRIDQYRDALWRLLVAANTAAGDPAAARRSQERYDAVLRDLGV